MKKILVGLFLVVSILSVADDKYDYVENKLELKYGVLKDGYKNTLNIDDFDVMVFNGNINVNMEIEAFSGDGGWEKFNKSSYDEIAKEIADDVRKMLNTTDKVEVTLVVDREVGKKELLSSEIY